MTKILIELFIFLLEAVIIWLYKKFYTEHQEQFSFDFK